MNVISVVRKYLIKDLTGLVENYYIQKDIDKVGLYGDWFVKRKNDEEYWNWILGNACHGGHTQIVKLAIKNGATHTGWAILGASSGNHLKLVKKFAEKCHNHYIEQGFDRAVEHNHSRIIKFFLKRFGGVILDYYSDFQKRMEFL